MKLSVAMITYNHEKFIVQALDSVLMQEVDFDYEIVIGDDLSQDRTREILLNYQAQYPEKIRLLLYETKQGPGGNIYSVLNSCQGDYIALLEGDDYWIASDKLQLQIDFLDLHLDFVLCFHSVEVLIESDQRIIGISNTAREGVGYKQEHVLSLEIYPRTCSVVHRSKVFVIPEIMKNLIYVDMFLWLLNAHVGLLGYIDKPMSVYRVHSQGVWSGPSEVDRLLDIYQTLKQLNEFYSFKYNEYFNIKVCSSNLARAYRKAGNTVTARHYSKEMIVIPNGGRISTSTIMKTLIIVYLYKIYTLLRMLKNHIKSYYPVRNLQVYLL